MTPWDSARQFLRFGKRRGGDVSPPSGVTEPPDPVGRTDPSGRPLPRPTAPPATTNGGPGTRRARSICIASGKGGTGKSTVSASLAAQFARRGRTLLLDADLGCANAHILQGARPEKSFADVLQGDVGVADIVTTCSNGVDLLAGGSGYASLAGLRTYELEMIGRGLARLEPDYEQLVVDSAAGLSRQTVAFAAACDLTVLVTTPDLTAMTDAYAFLKVFVRQCAAQGIERPMPLLLVNRATDEAEAAAVAKRLQDVVERFLGTRVEYLAALPEDRAAYRCSQRRTTVHEGEPDSELARALFSVGNSLLARLTRVDTRRGGAGTAGGRLADAAPTTRGL